eukprot:CAMPEP_0196239012 /NCGR_PEP_ID=MMETSP0913-20130531/7478_1 /TAXON_ID=49265 /ORGANISM="Thalassiosira rotula, Strain GSO102" /LENGTH=185 /DNA_ID=CAMNT_0041520843 /DNA_START=424 /DNA_END=977 /DNA_ORIENTATION=-
MNSSTRNKSLDVSKLEGAVFAGEMAHGNNSYGSTASISTSPFTISALVRGLPSTIPVTISKSVRGLVTVAGEEDLSSVSAPSPEEVSSKFNSMTIVSSGGGSNINALIPEVTPPTTTNVPTKRRVNMHILRFNFLLDSSSDESIWRNLALAFIMFSLLSLTIDLVDASPSRRITVDLLIRSSTVP